MTVGEAACAYAALILHDEGISITADKIATVVKAANVKVESCWPSSFAKLEKKSVEDLIVNVGSGGGGVAVAVAAPSGGGGGGAAATAAPAVEEEEEPK